MGRKPLFKLEFVLALIQKWILEHNEPPTIDELGNVLGIGSKTTVHRYLELLESKNLISRGTGARSIRPLRGPKSDFNTIAVPLVGTAPAGHLMAAEQNIEGWFRLPTEFIKPPSAKFFLLRVHGTSMNLQQMPGGNIGDQDLILVRQQAAADPNDVVVALIDGKATIKRLVKGPGYFVLTPNSTENKEYAPIVLGEEARVQGVVRRVFKKGTIYFDPKES